MFECKPFTSSPTSCCLGFKMKTILNMVMELTFSAFSPFSPFLPISSLSPSSAAGFASKDPPELIRPASSAGGASDLGLVLGSRSCRFNDEPTLLLDLSPLGFLFQMPFSGT